LFAQVFFGFSRMLRGLFVESDESNRADAILVL
jgi:hypothetical protein